MGVRLLVWLYVYDFVSCKWEILHWIITTNILYEKQKWSHWGQIGGQAVLGFDDILTHRWEVFLLCHNLSAAYYPQIKLIISQISRLAKKTVQFVE